MKLYIATLSVFLCIPVKTEAKRNSFHINMKHSTVVATVAVKDIGNVTLRKTLKEEHPSIKAASSISIGISSIKPFNIHIANGRLKATQSRESDLLVLFL